MQQSESGANGEAAVADPASQLAVLQTERDQLAQDKADLQDLLLRRQAEFDNFRKRSERERMEFAEYAGQDTLRAVLPALDDFDRALKAAETGDTPSDFLKGVRLVYQRLLDTLSKLGLSPIETMERRFDPHLHHAVEKVENAELEDHTILEEYQRGYLYKGRLLRPAMVKVAVQPAQAAAHSE